MKSLTTHDFDRDWHIVDKTLYTDEQRFEVQRMVVHIIGDHQGLFGGSQSEVSQLCGVSFICQYFERHFEEHLDSGATIHSLALPLLVSQGNITYVEEQGMYYALTSGNMKIVDFRTRQYSPEIVIHWGAIEGLEHDLDFRMLMTIRCGGQQDGLPNVSELLTTLRRWDALADIVDDQNLRTIRENVIQTHWGHAGEISFDGTVSYRISPYTFPEIVYQVTPMWSEDSSFTSLADMTRYLQLSKPCWNPKQETRVPNYYRVLPRGNGDYLVNYDRNSAKWAILFSPRLGLYYKVTVQLQGTMLDQTSNLQSAFLVCSNSDVYINKDSSMAEEVLPSSPSYFGTVKSFYDDPLVQAADEA